MRGRLILPALNRRHFPFLDTLPFTLIREQAYAYNPFNHIRPLPQQIPRLSDFAVQGLLSNRTFALHSRTYHIQRFLYNLIDTPPLASVSQLTRPHFATSNFLLLLSSYSCTCWSRVSKGQLPAKIPSAVGMDIVRTDEFSKNRKNYHPPDGAATQGLDFRRVTRSFVDLSHRRFHSSSSSP